MLIEMGYIWGELRSKDCTTPVEVVIEGASAVAQPD